jgi:hypothetical protein
VFDRDLAAPAAREERLAHMTALVTGFLTNRAARGSQRADRVLREARGPALTARGARR